MNTTTYSSENEDCFWYALVSLLLLNSEGCDWSKDIGNGFMHLHSWGFFQRQECAHWAIMVNTLSYSIISPPWNKELPAQLGKVNNSVCSTEEWIPYFNTAIVTSSWTVCVSPDIKTLFHQPTTVFLLMLEMALRNIGGHRTFIISQTLEYRQYARASILLMPDY